MLSRVNRTILSEKYTLLETLMFEDCAWKCDPFHIFYLLPQTRQLKMVHISSGGQMPQISLIGLKLRCWQHCFFLEAPWEILSLSLQASRGHLHCLARGPFLCPQSQPYGIYRSLYFSLSDLCFYHHTKMSTAFWGVYYYFGEVIYDFYFLLYTFI